MKTSIEPSSCSTTNSVNLDDIRAIDIHTHARVSTRNPPDSVAEAFDLAMASYFKEKIPRPTISETAKYYRERQMLAVILSVDTERAKVK
jgi:hypothetical protein